MAVAITHARTAQVPSSASAAGVSVWTRTGSPASVSICNQGEGEEGGGGWESYQTHAIRKAGKPFLLKCKTAFCVLSH